jgi:hypothetical protein
MKPQVELLEHALRAHGGLERWRSVKELTVQHTSGGLAFAGKFQGRTLAPRVAEISTKTQRAVLTPFPPGDRGVFEGDAVSIETGNGHQIARRLAPRSQLLRLRHRLWWDKLDLLYFTGSALWNYLSAPFVFTNRGFETRELEPWKEGPETWRRLAVMFPAEFHTHSRQQTFYFGEEGLLRRLDYTAEEFGKGAAAAHYCFDYREFGGLKFPTRRRVFLRRPDGRPRRRPQLIWIDIQAIRVALSDAAPPNQP